MTESSVVTVISNVNNSFKLSVPGRMVGAISQDRASGIFGLLRQAPKMIPVKVNLHTSRDRTETFTYEVANDSFLTPLLLNITLFNTITSSERALGESTISVKGEIRVKGQETIQIDRRFSASNAPIMASGSIAAPVSSLLSERLRRRSARRNYPRYFVFGDEVCGHARAHHARPHGSSARREDRGAGLRKNRIGETVCATDSGSDS